MKKIMGDEMGEKELECSVGEILPHYRKIAGFDSQHHIQAQFLLLASNSSYQESN